MMCTDMYWRFYWCFRLASLKTLGFLCVVCTAMYASPAQAQDTTFRASMVAAVAAHGADLASTEHCLGSGHCREMNPLLARFDQPAVFGAVKMGIVGAQLWALAKLHDRKPRLATAINLATAGVFAGVAIHNSQVAKGR